MPEGIALRTTKTEIETDDQGNQVKIDSYIKTDSGWDVLTTIEHTYDEHNNLIQTEKDGRVVYEAEYENLMIKSATGEAGETYTYTYDSLGQLTTVTKLGLTSEEAAPYPAQEHIYSVSEYDAAGRRVSSEITAGSLSLKSFYEYDSAGRLEEIREPGGFITSITYENGGRITRTTHPDGKEVVSTKRVDGLMASETGCCLVDKFYSYEVNEDGLYVETTTMKDVDGERWRKKYSDLLGRVRKMESPGYGGVINSVEYHYNGSGQLVRKSSEGSPDQLYEYDEFGNVIRLGADIDSNGSLDNASMDRIRERAYRFEYDSTESAYYMIRNGYTYAEDNSAVRAATGENRTRITGWSTDPELGDLVSENVAFDLEGNQSRARTYVKRDSKLVTRTVETPTVPTPVKTVLQNGRLVAKFNPMSGRASSYVYDALGRVTETHVPQGQTNTITNKTTYDPNTGFVIFRTDNLDRTTIFDYYDNGEVGAGRVKSVTDFRGKTVRYQYTSRGQVWRVWGETITPQEMEYNDYGEVIKVHKYFNGSNWNSTTWEGATHGTARITSVTYDSVTGLPLTATDPLGHVTSVNYDRWGRAIKKTNARGIEATYDFNPITRQLASVSFSDGTAGMSYDYDRMGRTVSLQDGVGQYTMLFGDHFKLEQANTNMLGLEKTFTTTYESGSGANVIPGRPKSVTMTDTQSGITDYFAEFSFDEYGRITGVEDLNEKFTYEYETGSNLITRIANADFAGHNVILAANYTYDPDRGSVTQLNNSLTISGSSSNISEYGYSYNDEGLLEAATRAGSSFTQAEFSKYEYNDRFELTGVTDYRGTDTEDLSDPIAGRDYSWSYDNNQNRLQEQTGTQTPIDYSYDVFDRLLQKSMGGVVQESYTYDADGNLLQDGVFNYTWNALNQLTNIDPVLTDLDAKRLSFKYDYQGRRVQKIVEQFNGASWAMIKNEKTLYNGWNPIAVYDGLDNNKLIRRYTWGLDISNSFGGAGGIGGLLSIEEIDGTNIDKYLIAYDAAGNVSQIVDSENGDVVAKYYYDAYGNLTGKSGTYADANPFRYQTKLIDEETGLIYYGYRYYNPSNGRFLGKDPMGGDNLYQFVGNNPVNGFEYLGLFVPDGLLGKAVSAQGQLTPYGPTSEAPGSNYEWKCSKKAHYTVAQAKNHAEDVEAGSGLGFTGQTAAWYTYDCKWVKKKTSFLSKIVAPVVAAIVTAATAGLGMPILSAAIAGGAGSFAGALAHGASLGEALIAGATGAAIAAVTAAILKPPPSNDGLSQAVENVDQAVNQPATASLNNQAGQSVAQNTQNHMTQGLTDMTANNIANTSVSSSTSAGGYLASDGIWTLDAFVVNAADTAVQTTASSTLAAVTVPQPVTGGTESAPQQAQTASNSDCFKLVEDLISQANSGKGRIGLGKNIMDRYTRPGSHPARFMLSNWFKEAPEQYHLNGTSGFRSILVQGGQNEWALHHIGAGASAELQGVGDAAAFIQSTVDFMEFVVSHTGDDLPFIDGGKNLDGLETAAEIAGNYTGTNVGRHLGDYLDGDLTETQLRTKLRAELCK